MQLVTFGGLHATSDDGELDWLLAQHSRAALLVYLAVEHRVSRESLTAVFWPESDVENARHALRQALYHLRKATGGEWVDSRAHELVVSGDVRTDANDFTNALERGDVASAVELYRGPFLDGIHLVDLTSWEAWVDSRRAHYARAFRKASRELLEKKRASGDLTGAVAVAECWTSRDPLDGEAQHRLIETLAAAGERADAIRQYETYVRLLEPDGLKPLEETSALAERLRSNSVPLPSVRTVAVPDGPPPAVSDETAGRAPLATRSRWAIGIAVLVLLLAGAWGLRRTLSEPAPDSNGTNIAVLPFTVHGAQTAGYLGDGIVNLLGAALDGAGSLRPVDTRAVFAAVSDARDRVRDRDYARRVAGRLGAGMYVLGDVVEAGGQLQIEASVYRANGDSRAKANVAGSADSVFDLVDRLAAQLLGALGDAGADSLLRTASLTTASLPAFKGYLEGEGLMRAGRFEQAADAYSRAIGLDSTFALAHYRLALAREWAPLPGEDAAAASAARHSARLSARDRDRLAAFRRWRAGDATEAERAYRSILARYPDDVDAWFQLAEILFHHGPLWGRPIGASKEAWRKVLSHEPRNLFALTHLVRIAIIEREPAAVDSLLAPFGADELRTDRRLAELVLLRAVARGDTVMAATVAEDVRRWEPFAVWRVAVFLTAFAAEPAAMRTVIAQLATDLPSPAQRADLHFFASALDLAGGRANAARLALAAAADAERTVPAAHRRWAFPEVTEWFEATLPLPFADSTLERVRRQATSRAPTASRTPVFESEMKIGGPIQLEPLRHYTLGTLALRLRDTTAATAAVMALGRLAAADDANALVRDLDRGLRARLAMYQGKPADALRLLESLESRDSQGDVAAIPFVSRGNERFLRGEVNVALARDTEALIWFASLGNGSVTEVPFRAPSHLRQAEIYERLGKRDLAAEHYARAAALWANGDPEFRAIADSARRGVARLTR